MAVVRSTIMPAAEAYLKSVEKQAEEAAYRALTKTGLVGEARIKGIIEREAYDTGRFLRSVNSKIYRSPSELRLVIGTNLEYAVMIELGRKPGKFPNLDALTKWVGRKLRARGVNTRVNVTFAQLKQLAKTAKGAQKKAYRQHLGMIYLVGRKIATKGIRQKLIFRRIEDGLLRYFQNELSKEMKTIA